MNRRDFVGGAAAIAAASAIVAPAQAAKPLIVCQRGLGGYIPTPWGGMDNLAQKIEARGYGKTIVVGPGVYPELAQKRPIAILGISAGGATALEMAATCKPKVVITIDPTFNRGAVPGVKCFNIYNSLNVLGSNRVKGAILNLDLQDVASLHIFLAHDKRVQMAALNLLGANI